MKITILQGAFLPVPPILGGALEKMWFELGKRFAAGGHDVTHVSRCAKGLPQQETIAGVKHRRVPGFDASSSSLWLKFLDLMFTLRVRRALPAADVLVTNTFWAPLLAPAAAGKICVDVGRMPKGQMKLYCRADRFRACSSAVARAIEAELPQRADRIKVIPNPLPFTCDGADGGEGKENSLLYTGRIHPEKGLDLLFEAFADVARRVPDWTLHVVGPWDVAHGGGGAGYRDRLRSEFPHARVVWHEPVFDTEALNEHYRKARIFVYPSLAEKGETFGLAPLEAMAWGCVPVVSDLVCFRDFIVDGENGVVFDHRSTDRVRMLAHALEKLMTDPDLPRKSAKAMRVRETHSLERIADLFMADFKELVGRL